MFGSFGKHKSDKGDDNCDDFELDICPDLLLAAIASAAAAAFALLYTAITMAGRRKRRELNPEIPGESLFLDIYWLGDKSRLLYDKR